MGQVWQQLGFADFSLLFGYGLALVFECVTLVRVIKGSKHRFVITILVMLIAANLAVLAEEIVFINEVKLDNFSSKTSEIYFGLDATGLLLFNIAHWMFAYKYFKMSRQKSF